MRRRLAQFALLVLGTCAAACDDEDTTPSAAPRPPEVVAPAAAQVPGEPVDLLQLLDTCDVWHRGYTIDLGSLAAESQRDFDESFNADVAPFRHGGGSFAEISSRSIDYQFWLTEPRDSLYVSARARGRRSGHLAMYVDGKRLGSAKLSTEEAKVVSFKLSTTKLEPGRHVLGLRLSRGDSQADGPYAEIEWLRLTSPDDADEQYAAPTLKDVVSDVVLQKRPRRAITLRGQSTVRCPLWPAADTKLRLWLGFWGEGQGRAELRILRQNGETVTLQAREVQGGENAGWNPIEVPLGKYAGELVGLEFGVRQAAGVGRVAFGDPALVRDGTKPNGVPRAQTVILVVMSGLRRSSLPPGGSVANLPGFGELVRVGTAFTNFRAPSTIPSAALASMLTGVSPRAHTLEDPAARLPKTVHTINEVLKQASGHAAMFTGVPTSFPAFGFDESWDEHQTISPVSDEPAHAPFQLAQDWLKKDLELAPEARRFVLLHLRGAHPPWDIPKEDAAQMKPEEYSGAMDPRRGGIALGNIRMRTRKVSRRLENDDWTRLRELELAALKKQDAAFNRLAKTLQDLGLWEHAMIIVAGDVGAGEPPAVPYEPGGSLDESRLYVPLLVKFPDRQLAGKEVDVPATSEDIALTVLAALGLEPPDHAAGHDLFSLAAGRLPLAGRPLWATLGDGFATRLGAWRLSGTLGKTPTLCELAIDPACVNDVFGSRGFVANSLWKWTFFAEKAARETRSVTREPASIDPETAAALAVWGDLSN